MIEAPKITTVAIDPGHPSRPGRPGAVSPCGKIVEHKYVMGPARMLNSALTREPGFAPMLLRHNENEVVSVPERAKIATEARADIVVSLHVDASKDRKRQGCTILYWPGNEITRQVAHQISLSFPPVLRTWGERAARERDWPRAARVIGAYQQPTVLVEMGFATNEDDVKALCETIVQVQIVGAIRQGLLLFRQLTTCEVGR
jgi:N-acetylmuramoyl-L-alanine amidase